MTRARVSKPTFHHIVRLLTPCLACVVVELLSIGAALASGDIGVGIQAEPLVLATTAQPGHTYDFPSVYVINNGAQPIAARFSVEPLNKGAQHVAPATWISFPSESTALRPGASAHVRVILHVPPGAARGTYLSDVVVHAASASASSGTGAQVSAGAATKVEFVVSTTAPHTSGGAPPWVLPGAIAAAALVVLLLLWRSGIRITIKKPS